jgi:TRAP-type uncharacterized transport system fused permease subunit
METLSKYDPELRFRRVTGITARVTFIMAIVLSIFHIYTAGFGVLQEWRHRTFHLAFVLPLVFFLYSIRRGETGAGKYFVYDAIYAAISSTILGTLFREVFTLSFQGTAWLAITAFFFILYFKRRALLAGKILVYLDFIIFSLMVGGLVYGAYLGGQHIHFRDIFRDPNLSLIFWSVLLFAIFLSIVLLFVLQWLQSLWALIKTASFRYDPDNLSYFDLFFAILASAVSVYIFLEFNGLVLRAGAPLKSDLVAGAFAILLVLEAARRSLGPPLPIICILVLVNCYLGPYFLDIPGLSFFAHRGYSIERIIEQMYLGTEGIYGIPLGVVATFVFHFVLFGIFISKTGLGQLFMDLAMAIAGWSSGGPAKVAVISSGFMGSISGSSIANTVTTGSFTIPLMKKIGYSPQFAGAVEAAASTGGQLMPPIMGAAAFIMSEFLGIPYIKIAICAFFPSFLHFYAVGIMVHFEAKKQGLRGLPRESLPKIWRVLRERWLLVGPLLIIIYLLIDGRSPFLAAFWGIIYSVAIGQVHTRTLPLLFTVFLTVPCVLFDVNPLLSFSSLSILWVAILVLGLAYAFTKVDKGAWLLGLCPSFILVTLLIWGLKPHLSAFWANMGIIAAGALFKESRMRLPDVLETLELGTKNAIAIGAACACVGFIVGATTLTGLGLKFAAAVIGLARGVASLLLSGDVFHLLNLNGITLFFTLIFTAISCFILGMGIPTTAQYIIASMIAAPALLQWGVHPLISHMFVLFYAVLADVTPPVALAAFAASGISGADPFRTGFTAFSLSMAKVFVPIAFVYAPVILLMPWLLDANATFRFLDFIQVVVSMVLGITALGATVIGYLRVKSTLLERFATGIAAACLIIPEGRTDFVGYVVLIAVFLIQTLRRRKQPQSPSSGTD